MIYNAENGYGLKLTKFDEESVFQKKINKAQRKYYKKAIKDIKEKILNAVSEGKTQCYCYYDGIINDDIIKYFEEQQIDVKKRYDRFIEIKW